MKKSRSMRLASALLVCTLLSTCMISGTFAKYTTQDSGSDSARVAKWGVNVTVDGSLFGKTYMKADNNTPGADNENEVAITVKSSTDEKVVAPGTKNDEGITATITGTPEVDVKVVIEVKGLDSDGNAEYEKVKDILLEAGTYPDMTTGDDTDKFSINKTYYPVKFTLTQDTGSGATEIVKDGKLSDVETVLENLSKEYDANTDLKTKVGTLKLTWKWDYGTAADTVADPWTLNVVDADKADTLLGNIMAETVDVTETSYNLETGIELSIIVEQID